LGKIVSREELAQRRREWKRDAKRVVFVAGAFDLLHPGHIRLLEQARSLGDILVVGVQSDAGVRASASQGAAPPRPIAPAAERAEIVSALAAVDFAVEFDEPSPHALVAHLMPDVIVEGAAPRARTSSDSSIADEATAGVPPCELVRIPLEPGYSTTLLIARIRESGPDTGPDIGPGGA